MCIVVFYQTNFLSIGCCALEVTVMKSKQCSISQTKRLCRSVVPWSARSPKWNGAESTSDLGMIRKCYFPSEGQEFSLIYQER